MLGVFFGDGRSRHEDAGLAGFGFAGLGRAHALLDQFAAAVGQSRSLAGQCQRLLVGRHLDVAPGDFGQQVQTGHVLVGHQ